ncbi:MAG: N-acetylmuramoyl-L-alanine amidase, partial [Oscillospiraceae bacterium]|nr:N-acetylmuramoyl-L-alanine amidase [Oscillospiraceae bacterium]
MNEKLWRALPLVLLLLAAVLFSAAVRNMRSLVGASAQAGHKTLVIDPGHGGIDGGAIALDGTKESEINLAIGLKLREIASFCGQPTVLTRVDDSQRTSFIAYSEHEDLVHRTEIINSVADGVLISIHQNCFPTSQPSGAQVLYAKGEESRRLGELTHG